MIPIELNLQNLLIRNLKAEYMYLSDRILLGLLQRIKSLELS
jgi:hypothetical protein